MGVMLQGRRSPRQPRFWPKQYARELLLTASFREFLTVFRQMFCLKLAAVKFIQEDVGE
jgi:hypothetical protein